MNPSLNWRTPSAQQLAMLALLPKDRGVYALWHWRWPQGQSPAAGLQSAVQALRQLGGAVLSHAQCDQLFIGESDARWHTVAVWSLPSAAALHTLVQGVALKALGEQADAVNALVALQPACFTHHAMQLTQKVMGFLPPPKASQSIPMDMMAGGVNPSPSQFEVYRHSPQRTPIHMVNLLKFRAHPDYNGAADQSLSGKQAYAQRYGAVAAQCIFRLGGNMVAMGRYKLTLIGAEGDPSPGLWDEIAVLQYPGRYAFLNMLSNPRYQAAALHRQAALERTALWATTPTG
ncbi:hypothetical protein NQT62_00975 [Limnobacter humi]|uniref:DUF1330 domain-containing protein n=1 Tax=Limnobacter humi TaxID=1778671 RepID=A0ABT1WBX0_9BURK|nr:hypothetical protein [Limnobacter humi]MCQ8895007.1 hypothetical protein [Limnobacter humi]